MTSRGNNRWAGGGLAALLAVAGLAAEPMPPVSQVMADGYYVRETRDQAWQLRITGEIPSLCGAWILVHDRAGRKVVSRQIPHGLYSEEAPWVLEVPRDGIEGDYVIRIIGHQRDLLGIRVPLSDLPGEVYGGNSFTIGHEPGRRIAFQVDESRHQVKLGAYKGHLTVRDATNGIVADTRQHALPDSDSVFRYSKVVKMVRGIRELHNTKNAVWQPWFLFGTQKTVSSVISVRMFVLMPPFVPLSWMKVNKPFNRLTLPV